MKDFKLVTLLGIRPDYIRMFKVLEMLDKSDIDHVLVHSGQHYDVDLFGNFLKELKVREPDIDLGIGKELKSRGKTNHVYQTSLLSERVFEMLEKVKPDAVMYLGDTNTVLSSITVARCGIPIIHLEAGGRSFDWRMPEEKNRIVIDGLADAMYSYMERYKELLLARGIEDFRVKVIGNIIVDAIERFQEDIDSSNIMEELDVKKKEYILVTLHREENISTKEILENKLSDILKFGRENNLPVVLPLMPRTKGSLEKFGISHLLKDDNLIVTKPLPFFAFSKLEKNAKLIVTDSGTVQEDALIFGVPCVVARRSTERPETIWAGATILEGLEGENILYNKIQEAYKMSIDWDRSILNPNGGSPSERVVEDLMEKISNNYFKESRSFDSIKHNKFVRQTYNKE